jgi:hypothetical protein
MLKPILAIGLLLPIAQLAQATSQQAADEPEDDVRHWSLQELCEARDDPAALAEIERRDIFSRRELRVIANAQLRPNISVEALLCFAGLPDRVMQVAMPAAQDPVDAYLYVVDVDVEQTLVVHVRHRKDESKVVRWFTTAEPIEDVESWAETRCRVRTYARPGCPSWNIGNGPRIYDPPNPRVQDY